MKRKTISTLATLVTAAVVLVGGYIFQNDSDKIPQSITGQDSATQSSVAKNNSTKNNEELEIITIPESIVKAKEEGIEPFRYINAKVTKVTDGDTFHIEYNNKDYKVRMLDIDTPESVKSGVEPQPYALEASDFTKKTLTGKKIKLVFEKGTTDQFGRLLAHVILENGTYYNALMIQNGFAISVFYSPNTLLKDYFTDLQSRAIADKKGFWQLPENERPFIENSKGKLVAAYKLKSDAA